jgi:glycosyltransferase involved in cell wall biosynthesis
VISFIVPGLNEAENIGPTLATIAAAAAASGLDTYEIIVIDDGSTDAMPQVVAGLAAADPRIRPIRHATNQGIGASIIDGIAQARFEKFMVIPGDNDLPEGLMRALLACRDRADAILTVPFNKEMRGRRRNFLSMLYQAIYMAAFGIHVGYINGPGIWPTERARALTLHSRRFSIISELNVKLLRSGGTYAEVPGHLQGGQKARSTVTFRNLCEVVVAFLRLLREVHFAPPSTFDIMARRVRIDFAPLPADPAAGAGEAGTRGEASPPALQGGVEPPLP